MRTVKTNCSFLDGNTHVYSPVSKKNKNAMINFGMVLRPRVHNALRRIKSIKGLYLPLKTSDGSKKKVALNDVTNQNKNMKANKKFNKDLNNTSFETPYQFYMRQLTKTPSTPDNPFNATPSSMLRRSRRISILRSAMKCTPASNEKKSLAGRKRKLNSDGKSTQLSPFSSGMQTLFANSNELSKAITHNDESGIACKKSCLKSEDAATKSTGWSYSPMFDSCDRRAKRPSVVGTNKLGRGSIRRRLSVRLRKTLSKEDRQVQSVEKVESMLGVRQLRGKYNQALYYDG